MSDYEYHLDVFGQHTAQIYTQICLCFPTTATTPREHIVSTLNNGLNCLATAFPWTAGNIVKDDEGVFKIETCDTRLQVVVKDLFSSTAMRTLRKADFPIASLDEDLLCPVKTQPDGLDVWPVFVVQATFVDEGLLLTYTLQHQVGDMTALAQVMYLLNKACCNEEFTEEEVSIGNVDRRTLFPLFEDIEQVFSKDQSNQSDLPMSPMAKPHSKTQKDPVDTATSPPTLSWANIAFSPASLTVLKAEAMQDVPTRAYVSTDDALSAFIWRHMTLAKLPRLGNEATTTFGRTVDMRRHVGIPMTYAGVAATKASVTEDPHELATQNSLGGIAIALREAIDHKTTTLAHEIKLLATLRARGEVSNAGLLRLDPTKDVMLSSWAKYTEIWSFDFGLGLGEPESVRRPLFRPAKEGLVYLLPKRPDGEIVAVLCIREEDLGRLKKDEVWMRWGRWVG